jgi:hypothetical protein
MPIRLGRRVGRTVVDGSRCGRGWWSRGKWLVVGGLTEQTKNSRAGKRLVIISGAGGAHTRIFWPGEDRGDGNGALLFA